MPYKVIHTILDLLFPVRCLGCRKANAHICPSCLLHMQRKNSECFFCGVKINKSVLNNICSQCIRKSPLSGIWWPWHYQNETTKKVITAYKYRRKKWLAPALSAYIKNAMDMGLLPSDSIIIPVPLSQSRQVERGFNQAELLADNLPFEILRSVAIKVKDTPQQARTHSKNERIDHMRDAFLIKNPSAILGRTILLVDDVATTGATLCELAKTLKNAGSGLVYAAVLAHG